MITLSVEAGSISSSAVGIVTGYVLETEVSEFEFL